MSTKVEYRMEFDRSKKAIVVQGVLGGSGSVTIIDKRLLVKDKKDFGRLYGAFDKFNAIAHELVVCEHKADSEAETVSKCKWRIAMLHHKKEFLEEALPHSAIKYLQSRQPDVFFCLDRIGYVQAWKYGRDFWLECKGVNGEYFTNKFHGDDMINTCETYFGALRTGYPLWEV